MFIKTPRPFTWLSLPYFLRKAFPYLLAIGLFLAFTKGKAQALSRLRADLSITWKDDKDSLYMISGTVYYDQRAQQQVFRVNYPHPQIWVTRDTTFLCYEDTVLITRATLLYMQQQSIFAMALNGKLSAYGLEDSRFELISSRRNGQVLEMEWKPPADLWLQSGNIILRQDSGRLVAMAITGLNKKPLVKNYYGKYVKLGPIVFPTEIIEITPAGKHASVRKLYQFTNVRLDEPAEDAWYFFGIPAAR